MSHKISTTVNGKTYSSIADMCKAHGINHATFRARYKRGISLKEALCPADRRDISLTYEGKTYSSIKEIASKFNLAGNLVSGRLRKGWSLEKALTISANEIPTTSEKVVFRDKTYSSKAALAKSYNIDVQRFYQRIAQGWTLEESLGLQKRLHHGPDECDGKIYKIVNTKTGLCYVGLTTKELYFRLNQHISTANCGSNTKLSKAIRKYGSDNFKIKLLAKVTSRQRLSQLEQKFILQFDSVNNGYNSTKAGNLGGLGAGSTYKQIIFKGKIYPSVAELCRTFNIPRSRFEERRKRGWNIKKCLDPARYPSNGGHRSCKLH